MTDNIDRLAKDVLEGIEKDEFEILEVPIKLLFQILFPRVRANEKQLHDKLVEMKLKYDELDYVVAMAGPNSFARFYKKSPKKVEKIEEETKLIEMEEDDDRSEDISTS